MNNSEYAVLQKAGRCISGCLVALSVAFAASCEGKVGGTYAFGTVDGQPLRVNSAFVSYFACPPVGYNEKTGDGPSPPETMAVIVLAEAADACVHAKDAGIVKNPVAGLTMVLLSYVSTAGMPPPAGSYSAWVNLGPDVWYANSAADVVLAGPESTIVLDRATATGATGTFNLTFFTRGSLRGAFVASECDLADPRDVFVASGVCPAPNN